MSCSELTFMLRRCYLLGIKQLKLYGKEIEIGGRHPVKIDSSLSLIKHYMGKCSQGSFLSSMHGLWACCLTTIWLNASVTIYNSASQSISFLKIRHLPLFYMTQCPPTFLCNTMEVVICRKLLL